MLDRIKPRKWTAACCVGLRLLLAPHLWAQKTELKAYPEYLRVDPFGQVVAADRAGATDEARKGWRGRITLQAARGGYVSFQLAAELAGDRDYTLDLNLAARDSGIQSDAYREWFHFLESANSYYPDALVPVHLPYRAHLPAADNRIRGQTAQAFWIDIWIPPSTNPGLYSGRAILVAGHHRTILPIELKVLLAVDTRPRRRDRRSQLLWQ